MNLTNVSQGPLGFVATPTPPGGPPRRKSTAWLTLICALLVLTTAGSASAVPIGSPSGASALVGGAMGTGSATKAGRGVSPVGKAPTPGQSWEEVGMTAGFDPPEQRWNSGHRGVDLKATSGADVVAPVGGKVAFAGSVAGRPTVSIEVGGGWRTTLEPVAAVVENGDTVASGQVIGTVAAGGHCDGRCVHWGLVTGSGHGAEYRDPRTLVSDLRPSVLYLDRVTPPR